MKVQIDQGLVGSPVSFGLFFEEFDHIRIQTRRDLLLQSPGIGGLAGSQGLDIVFGRHCINSDQDSREPCVGLR